MDPQPGRTRCMTCNKERVTAKCSGCLQDYCYTHLGEHREQLRKRLDDIEEYHNKVREAVNELTNDSNKHPLIQKIYQWEQKSIQKIKETTEETKKLLLKHIDGNINEIEQKLSKLNNKLRLSREEDDIIETDLVKWIEDLKQMTEELYKPPHVKIQQDSTALINKLQVESSNSEITPKNVVPSKKKNVRALYSFSARNPGEISFNKDDILVDCELTNEGWMSGKNSITGQIGLLPSTYVQIIN